ncbi:MAG: formyltransferase family protein [Balneolaceae bacterium]
MNIVIISDFTSRELFIVEKIIAEYPSAVVVQPVSGLQKTENKSTKKHSLKQFINRITWKIHRLLWDRKFYPDKNFPEIKNNFFIPFSILNRPEGIRIFSDLAPDVIITCRAPLLCKDLIQIPEIAAVNIHFGLSPNYRGNDTLFWPLYYKDYSHLGGCIHHITPGIDTGNILAEVYPPLGAFDGEIAVDYNTTVLLAEAAVQYLKATERAGTRLPGKPQKEKGRNFNLSDRSFGKSLSYLMKRSVGLSLPPKRKGKIVTHFMPSD